MIIKHKKTILLIALLVFHFFTVQAVNAQEDSSSRNHPNIILLMADDLGWGDVGYNGNLEIQTPNLDAMAASGLQFNRFYAAAPVCSPTRGSVLTGRHPFRYGIYFANVGHMKKQEITLPEALKTKGYITGHFGKWHLGTMSKIIYGSNRGGRAVNKKDYAPPWTRGYDVTFATESKVPTWNPMINPHHSVAGSNHSHKAGDSYGTYYWTGPGHIATENLKGDDSRIIMDRVIPFIKNAVGKKQPFFTTVWFHTPHTPIVTGKKYRNFYRNLPENKQYYYGTITAMDQQIGRLRHELQKLGIAENTIIWFCSDNGPAGEGGGTTQHKGKRQQGSTGPFRGRKGSLFEGGIRVPGFLVWPAKIKKHRTTNIPVVTSDYYSTILSLLDIKMPEQPKPIDGINLLPLVNKKMSQRSTPIAFQSKLNQKLQIALSGNRYKLISIDGGNTFMLFDLINDQEETKNLIQEKQNIANKMETKLLNWIESCKNSEAERDYVSKY